MNVIFTIKSKRHIGNILSQIGRIKVVKIGNTNKYTLDMKYNDVTIDDNFLEECKKDIQLIDADATIFYKVLN